MKKKSILVKIGQKRAFYIKQNLSFNTGVGNPQFTLLTTHVLAILILVVTWGIPNQLRNHVENPPSKRHHPSRQLDTAPKQRPLTQDNFAIVKVQILVNAPESYSRRCHYTIPTKYKENNFSLTQRVRSG